jgi:(p)ppGpp synthase/HD superfamily hydrolase
MAAHAATIAHDGQFRKNKLTPYIVHPASVAQMVLMYNPTCYLGAITAWCHDILEDCGDRGMAIFIGVKMEMPLVPDESYQIGNAVKALTKDDSLSNRTVKWEDCIRRFIDDRAPPFTILVKMCDRIDNLMDMDGFTPEFKKTYIEETDMMIRAINRRLLNRGEQNAFNDLKRLRNYIAERDNIPVLTNL